MQGPIKTKGDGFNVLHLPGSSLEAPPPRLTVPVWETADTHRQVCAVPCNSMQVFLISAEVPKMSPRLIWAGVSIYTMWGFPDLCRLAQTLPGVIVPSAAVGKDSSQVVRRRFEEARVIKRPRYVKFVSIAKKYIARYEFNPWFFWGLASFLAAMSGWKQSPGLPLRTQCNTIGATIYVNMTLYLVKIVSRNL